jgi:uncharacterized repeat protein (TIGR01451 family)
MSQARKRILIAPVAVALLLGASACGSSKPRTTTSSTSTSATNAAPAGANPTTASTPTSASGPVHATLHGANHTPVAGKNWTYTVRVTNAAGKPLAGTVETDFVFAGLGVVGKETPAVHKLKNGMLTDTLQFPTDAVGHPITLVTVVHTGAGSVALGWPVNVSK